MNDGVVLRRHGPSALTLAHIDPVRSWAVRCLLDRAQSHYFSLFQNM